MLFFYCEQVNRFGFNGTFVSSFILLFGCIFLQQWLMVLYLWLIFTAVRSRALSSRRSGAHSQRGSLLPPCSEHRAVWRGRVFSFSCSESRLVAPLTDCIFSFFSELPVQTKTAANESFTNINEALNSQVFSAESLWTSSCNCLVVEEEGEPEDLSCLIGWLWGHHEGFFSFMR